MTLLGPPSPAVESEPSDVVVQLDAVSKRYRSRAALAGLDLRVPRGSVYGLLGPNGAGKSTALRAVLGLTRTTSGRISLFGQPWRRAQLARVGALIEAPTLYPHLTALEHLRMHAALVDLTRPHRRIGEVLELVGLGGAAGTRAGQFSLGMKQRLGLAVALLAQPELLILDEPTNGLDPVGVRDLRTLISTLPAHGHTVVMSSHLLSEVAQVATHVGILNGGRQVYEGKLTALLDQQQGHVRLEVRTTEPDRAGRVLAASGRRVQISDSSVEVALPEAVAAQALATLVHAGVTVQGFSYQQDDLEARFLRMIGATEGPA